MSNLNQPAGRDDDFNASPDGTATLMAINGLNYGANDSAMSVVSSRKFKVFPAIAAEYSPQGKNVLEFILSTGSEYMNGRNSYIVFDVDVSGSTFAGGATGVSFGTGKGATNLFSELLYLHSSSTEIDRINDVATCAHIKRQSRRGSDYLSSIAEAVGVDDDPGAAEPLEALPPDVLPNFVVPGGAEPGPLTFVQTNFGKNVKTTNSYFETRRTFIVPLSDLSDIFDQSGQLLPNYLVAGSRLQLTLNEAWKAFVTNQDSVGATSVQYTLQNCRIVLDLYTLVDNVVRELSVISANSGLSLDFSGSWRHHSSYNSQSFTANVTKALSQVNAVHVWIRDQDYLENTTEGQANDHFNTVPIQKLLGLETDKQYNYQFALGSNFIPQAPVYSPTEAFWHYQTSWATTDHTMPNTVGLNTKYAPPIDYNSSSHGATFAMRQPRCIFGCISQTMERNSILAHSGQAISAQRGLQVSFNLAQSFNSDVTIFLDYVRLIDVFTDQIAVRI